MTALANGTLLAAVTELVAARTMYEPEYLRPDTHLEGELGVDSVILQSMLASLQEQFGLAEPLGSDVRTVAELTAAVERALTASQVGDAGSAAPSPTTQAIVGGLSATQLGRAGRPAAAGAVAVEAVLAATAQHTGYGRDRLNLDADLERDLGIDSVVITAIIAQAGRDLGRTVTPGPSPRTLRELTARFDLASTDPASPPRPSVSGRDAAPTPTGQPEPDWDDRSMKDFMDLPDPDLFAKARAFTQFYQRRQQERLYWYGMPLLSQCRNRAVIRDEQTGRTREYLMFASNNYLGLANHPRVIEAICDATVVYGATHTGCRIIGGTNRLHKELEERLAAFKKRADCIVFPSGYSANLGVISALARSSDTVISDKFNHMSIVDGTKLAGATRRIYQHNNMSDLEQVLQRSTQNGGGNLIVTDGVFSMHGDICNLPEIVRLAKQYGARLLVDDAHATGVLGQTGSGTAEHFDLKGEVDLELGTMSKALGGMGGFVVGDAEVIEYLRFYANSYVFAATIPAGIAAGLIAALDILQGEPERLRRLWHNIEQLRAGLTRAGFNLESSNSAVLPVVLGDDQLTLRMGRAVRERGLFCQTVVFPGVSVGEARLRVSVTSEHTQADISEAIDIFTDAATEVGALPGDIR